MRTAWGLVADVVFVVVFAILGRASHSEGLSVGSIAVTAWPFLVGAVLAWIATYAWVRKEPRPSLLQGAIVVGSTVTVGHILRVASGGSTHWSFVVVSLVTVAVLLLGWRLVARWGLRA